MTEMLTEAERIQLETAIGQLTRAIELIEKWKADPNCGCDDPLELIAQAEDNLAAFCLGSMGKS